MESEYKAISQATQESVWMRELLRETKFFPDEAPPIPIFTDSQSAIDHASSHIEKGRTKHIEVTYHYVREKVEARDVTMSYVPSEVNVADILTKPLPGLRHQRLTKQLSISES